MGAPRAVRQGFRHMSASAWDSAGSWNRPRACAPHCAADVCVCACVRATCHVRACMRSCCEKERQSVRVCVCVCLSVCVCVCVCPRVFLWDTPVHGGHARCRFGCRAGCFCVGCRGGRCWHAQAPAGLEQRDDSRRNKLHVRPALENIYVRPCRADA